jgi:GDP-mannose 4,6-dehydratase
MNIFITGATGFVGSHMIDYLLAKDSKINIFAFTRWRSDTSNIKHILSSPRVTLINGDLSDIGSIHRALEMAKPDVIYHFAAQSLPETSFYTPVHTIETNTIGTTNLFETIRLCDIDPLVVSVSTSEVYGNPTEDEIPITESNPIRAANPYSISKVGHDLMSQYYHKAYGIRIVITRMFSHEGARRGKMFALSSFAHQIVTAEKDWGDGYLIDTGGPKYNINYTVKVGNLDSVRTYNHISDAVEAYWLCINSAKVGEIYNIGGDETCTVGEALERLLHFSKIPREQWEIVVDPARVRPTDITLQVPSSDKFREETGWKPTKGVDDICIDLLNYWRDIL